MEDHVDAVLGPPGVGVDSEPLEGSGQEVFRHLFGGTFLLLWGGGVSRSMTSSPVVLVLAFFLEAVAEALLFLAFAIVDGGSFLSPSLSVVLSVSLVMSVLDDDSVALPAI